MVGLVFSVLEVVAVVNHMLVAHMQAMVVPGADMRLEVVVQEVMVQVAQVQMEPQESLVAVMEVAGVVEQPALKEQFS